MTRPDFFPDLAFGWTFYCVLVLYLIAASIVDFRSLKVPKVLTVSCLAVGLLFNLSRGMWLGIQDKVVWLLPVGPIWGLLDGLLFSAAGFAAAFAIFFLLWFVRATGGGDVKLFSAVGAWVGPVWAIWLLIGSVAMIVVIATVVTIVRVLTSGFSQTRQAMSHETAKKAMQKGKIKKRGPTYSLSLLVATALIMLMVLRQDLGILPKPPDAPAVENSAGELHSKQAKGS